MIVGHCPRNTLNASPEGAGNITKPVVKTIYLVQEGTPLEPSKAPEKKKKG